MEPTPAVIHLDLDGSTHVYRAHGWAHPAPEDRLFATGLTQALNVFDQYGIRATLFVIVEDMRHPDKRDAVKEAVRRGHEIASHSLTHRKLTGLSREEKQREIFASREQLAAILNVPVRGFRAPGFDIDRESLELLDAAGYTYDSSLFPTRACARRVGVAQLAGGPHRPLADRPLLELPLPAYGPLPTPFHPSYSLVIGTWYFQLGLWRSRRTRAPLVMLFHLTDFADPLPRAELPGWESAIFTLSHLSREQKVKRCGRMLEFVRRTYRLTHTEELLRADDAQS